MSEKPKEIFLRACNEIAHNFSGFKAVQKGRMLTRLSKNKNFSFEIYFDTSRRNYKFSIEIKPIISIICNKTKTCIFEKNIGYLTARQEYQTWNLAGASFEPTIKEITEKIQVFILPIFELFENTDNILEFLLKNGTKFNKYIRDLSIEPFYFIFNYGGKEKAEIFINHFVTNCSYKGKFYRSYEILKSLPKEEIDLKVSSFVGEDVLKFAVFNDIKLKK